MIQSLISYGVLKCTEKTFRAVWDIKSVIIYVFWVQMILVCITKQETMIMKNTKYGKQWRVFFFKKSSIVAKDGL